MPVLFLQVLHKEELYSLTHKGKVTKTDVTTGHKPVYKGGLFTLVSYITETVGVKTQLSLQLWFRQVAEQELWHNFNTTLMSLVS